MSQATVSTFAPISTLPTAPAAAVVTEEMIFAISNRIGMSFGDVANVLFAAQAIHDQNGPFSAHIEKFPTTTRTTASSTPEGIALDPTISSRIHAPKRR